MSAIKFKQVLRATGVREGEDRLVIVFMLFAFLVGMSAVFTQVAAYALFLSSYTSDSLPYVYIGVAVAVTIATPIYLRLKARGSLPRFLRFAIVFLIASLAVLWLALLLGENRILYMALPIWHEVVAALHGLIFWELAGRLFDVRQGKRLFGTIRSVEFFAGIVGGFSASALVALIGTRNLMGLSVAANVGLLLVCGYILRRWADRFGSDEKNKEKEKRKPPRPPPSRSASSCASVSSCSSSRWSACRSCRSTSSTTSSTKSPRKNSPPRNPSPPSSARFQPSPACSRGSPSRSPPGRS